MVLTGKCEKKLCVEFYHICERKPPLSEAMRSPWYVESWERRPPAPKLPPLLPTAPPMTLSCENSICEKPGWEKADMAPPGWEYDPQEPICVSGFCDGTWLDWLPSSFWENPLD